eukprot:INCI7168.5.p1 GENE.INCI7168.5~~INCI7168.5.p1  ORF type:complete len:2647 (+),score=550.22 INCI7168.5:170-7942(+)
MSERVYFRSPKEGAIADIAKTDAIRAKYRESLDSDAARAKYDHYLESNLRQRQQMDGGRKVPSTTLSLWEVGLVHNHDEPSGKVTVEVIEAGSPRKGKLLTLKEEDTNVYDRSHEESCEDVALISEFSEAPLLENLRRRFLDLKIYTYVSDIVIVLNPYFRIPAANFIPDPLPEFIPSETPHVYAAAHFAYHEQCDVKAEPRSQSVIVSGESGAGKTVACKMVMAYLAKLSEARAEQKCQAERRRSSVVDSLRDGIEEMVLACNPFLEAFGNAKTNMNDNSSRFGKFTKIWFSDGRLCGAEMEHYLLEKSRVTFQERGQRSFHIFYFLIRGATEEERKRYHIRSKPEDYQMFSGGTTRVENEEVDEEPGSYDVREMKLVRQALMMALTRAFENNNEAGTEAAARAASVCGSIMRIVSGIMLLCDLQFRETRTAAGMTAHLDSTREVVDQVVEVLGIRSMNKAQPDNATFLETMLCTKAMTDPMTRKVIRSPVDGRTARFQCDALAKEIYHRLFQYIVSIVNMCLGPDPAEAPPEAFVGILDIFGFEIFGKKNSLEQLCINFANEKLQKLFNDHVFETEKTTYINDGIDVDSLDVSYTSNAPCVKVIEHEAKSGFIGVMPLLDSQLENATDEGWCRSLLKFWGFSKKAGTCKTIIRSKSDRNDAVVSARYVYGSQPGRFHAFCVAHFAGEVTYAVENFLLKNRDKFPQQLKTMMSHSSEALLKEIFGDEPNDDDDSTGSGRRRKPNNKKTICAKFKVQLRRLSQTISGTAPHYIRCIKPNDCRLRPIDGVVAFDAAKTQSQLLYSGVMEVCRIKKQGYPYRMKIELFWDKCRRDGICRMLNLETHEQSLQSVTADGVRDACVNVLSHILPPDTFVVGRTTVFAKDGSSRAMHDWVTTQVANRLRPWLRFRAVTSNASQFIITLVLVQEKWRKTLFKLKYEQFVAMAAPCQSMVRCCLAAHRLAQQRAKVEAKTIVLKAWHNYRLAEDFVALHDEYRRRKCRINLQRLVTEVMRLIAWRRFGRKLVAWHKYIRGAMAIQGFVKCAIASHELRCLKDTSKLASDLREELTQRVTQPMQQVLHEVDDLGLAQAGLLKVAVQSLIDSHAIAHDNTDPHAVTHLNQWDPDAAKSAIAAAHNSLTYLEASKEKVLAFQRNLTENVLRPLAALEEQYAAELLDGKEALQHQFAVAKELVATTLGNLRTDHSDNLEHSLQALSIAKSAVEDLDVLCAQAEQLHDDVRQCLEIPMEELVEEGLELSVPVVRTAYDEATTAIDEAVRSIGTEVDSAAAQAKITRAAEAISALESINSQVKESVQLFKSRVRHPLAEQLSVASSESDTWMGNSLNDVEVIRKAFLDARHIVGEIEEEIRTCKDVDTLRTLVNSAIKQVDGIAEKRIRVSQLLQQIQDLRSQIEAIVAQELTCQSTFMTRKIQEAQDAIDAAQVETFNFARDIADELIVTASNAVSSLAGLEQDVLILMQDYKMRVVDPYSQLRSLAEEYGTATVGAMKHFFDSFDVRLRDFSAAIEVRGVSDLASVYNELDVMAVDIARHREVNKDLANTWSRFASRVRFPLDTLKEEAMQSLVSSLPVVKRTIAALAARVKQFEGAVEVGTEDSTSLGDMLDELASSVAAAQGVVDRVKRLHNTFNEKVSAPFTELQREAQETGSSDLPLVRSKMDAAQQALAKAYQTIDFTGNEEESSAAIETAIALVAEAEAIHTTCSRGIVEHRKEKARFDSLAKQVEEKKAEITSVANGVFQVPEVRDMMEQVTHSLSVTRGVLDDDHHLSHPYAYSDAVNALEADIKSLGRVITKGTHFMWGLKYARDTELAKLSAAEEALAVLETDHEENTAPNCEATVVDLERRIIDAAKDTMEDAKKLLKSAGAPPQYFPSVQEATACWQLKVEEACNSVEKVNQAIKKRRREQALKDQQRREIFSQTVQLMEKYGAIKVTAQKFGLTDFPDVSIAVAAADEAVDICRQELSARNPTAAKTAAEMAARAVAQMEVVVHRARERHEWELPQRHECADALDGIDKALQEFVDDIAKNYDFSYEDFLRSNENVQEIFRDVAEYIDAARRALFSQGDIEELKGMVVAASDASETAQQNISVLVKTYAAEQSLFKEMQARRSEISRRLEVLCIEIEAGGISAAAVEDVALRPRIEPRGTQSNRLGTSSFTNHWKSPSPRQGTPLFKPSQEANSGDNTIVMSENVQTATIDDLVECAKAKLADAESSIDAALDHAGLPYQADIRLTAAQDAVDCLQKAVRSVEAANAARIKQLEQQDAMARQHNNIRLEQQRLAEQEEAARRAKALALLKPMEDELPLLKATAVVHGVQDEHSVQDAFAACKHSLDLATAQAMKGDVELTQAALRGVANQLSRYRAVVESERQHQAASTNGVARLNIAADQLSRARLLVSDAEQLLPAVARVQAQTFSSPKRTRHGQFSEHEEWKWGGHLEEPDLDGKVPDVPEVLVWAISRAEDLIKQSHDSMTPWLTTNTAMTSETQLHGNDAPATIEAIEALASRALSQAQVAFDAARTQSNTMTNIQGKADEKVRNVAVLRSLLGRLEKFEVQSDRVTRSSGSHHHSESQEQLAP